MNARRAIRGFLGLTLLSSVFVAAPADLARAQWIQTSGPTGGLIRSFASVPDGAGGARLFAGQQRVWSTDDQGESWTNHSNGLTDPNAFSLLVVPNGSGGNDVLVGTNGGVFRSTDSGASWNAINDGITNLSIYSLTSGPNGAGGTHLYAGTFMGNAFRSSNGGASWTSISTGLPVGQANINALTTTASGTVLAGSGGIYRSTNFGASWTRVHTQSAFAFAKHGTTIIAGTSSGVFRSTNDGATWTAINNGMVFTWTYAVAMIPNGGGATLFGGAGRVMRSTDDGANWTVVDNGLPIIGIYALATVPNAGGGMDLYAGTSEGIFRSTNQGDSWSNVSFVYSGVQALKVTPSGAILAGTESDVFRSTDGGESWTDTGTNASTLDFTVNPHGTNGVSVWAGGANVGLFKSSNDGVTWTGVPIDDIEVNSLGVVPNGSGGTNVLAATYSGIFTSTNDGSGWHHAESNAMPLEFVVVPNGSGGHTVYGGGFGGVWRSTDAGMSWSNVGFAQTPMAMTATENGASLFVGGDPFGVHRSTNGGATWTPVNSGLTDLRIGSLLTPDGTHLFAGGAGGVFLSSDQGASWTSVGTGLTAGVASLAVSGDGSTLLAGTWGRGVWKRPLSEMLPNVSVPPIGERGLALHANHPNPFQSTTTIQYSLPRAMPVRLAIHDVTGRKVRLLVNGIQSAGNRHATWDGKNESGSLVSPGLYVFRLDADGVSLARKMALVK
jgi:photosystem II stability/assembly factor-like uncharacterized protein